MRKLQQEILLLNRDERLELIQYIVDSLRSDVVDAPTDEVLNAQSADLKRRIESISNGTAQFVTWNDIQSQLGLK